MHKNDDFDELDKTKCFMCRKKFKRDDERVEIFEKTMNGHVWVHKEHYFTGKCKE